MKRIFLTALSLAISLSLFAQSNTTQIEYFLDTDNGYGLNTILDITTPNIDITQTVLADIPELTNIGYHKLYIRVKDEDGNWSQTIRKHIEVVAPFTQNNIIMGEYFLDEDSEYGTATTFDIDPEQEDIEQAFFAQIDETAPLGYHKLYGRVKDSRGNWSQTFRKNIEVYKNPITNVIEIEYFFDDDLEFSNNNIVNLSTPEEDGTWTFDVPYPAGDYDFNDVLFIRVKDSNNRWSITTILDEVASLDTENWLQRSTLVHPNPFNETINIHNNNKVIEEVKIYDTLGQEVFQSLNYQSEIDLSHLKSGLYILNLKTNSGEASFKIIKK